MISEVNPISPKFSSEDSNSPVELGYRDVEISYKDRTIQARGRAQLNLGLRERVIVTVEIENEFDAPSISYSRADLMVRVEGSDRPTASISIQTRTTNEKCELKLVARSGAFELCRDRRIRLKSAILHLLNFPAFVSLGEGSTDFEYRKDNSRRRLGRAVLQCDDWLIEIQELPNTKKIVQQLKENGGSGITHVIKLQRKEKRSFSVSALWKVINDLHRFLSFARGQWTSLFGPVGFDARDAVAYESWGTLLSAPWQSGFAWLDIHHGECLAQAYPGFIALLRNPELGDAACSGLYWYLRSNRGGDGAGVDSGLILSQAALERIAVAVLTAAGRRIPQYAHEKIREACRELSIPVDLPQHYSELHKATRLGGITDSIDAITRVRNELVHPKRKMKVKLGPLIVPCWQLSQWYIELFLLKMSGYQGVYSNRLSAKWVGQVEPVPWTSNR
jgi:hypothetical protein